MIINPLRLIVTLTAVAIIAIVAKQTAEEMKKIRISRQTQG